MNRRQAVKSIALSTGAIVSSGVVLSLLQACQSSPSLPWTPQFFSLDEAAVISRTADIIIPRTAGMPGAVDVAVPPFIDLLYKDIFSADEGARFKAGIDSFNRRFSHQHRGHFAQASAQQQQRFVESLYNVSNSEEQRILALIKMGNVSASQTQEYTLYSYLVSLRELTIEAFFTSETIGEQHLAYLPIPGEYDGDFPVTESTKVWSL